ncbi:MAG TPA: nitroreductase family deazaflavin-dependent oxidoreductase [Candidatus Binatia bacterium]|nr:nitroreductase family deazaflavin-dependent oxidoreductase [Candidatus Binatia bacterium]
MTGPAGSDHGWGAADVEAAWNCRLETVGRKSGLPRTVTLWFVPEGDRVYLAGGAAVPQWCRNVRANPAVAIEVGGVRRRGRARVVEDASQADAIRERFVRRYVLARLSRLFGGYTSSVPVVVELEPKAS